MTFTRTAGRTEEMLLRHVEALAEGDLDALMSDYCEDAVLITPEGVFKGSGEIRAFFEPLIRFPGSTLEVSQQIAERTIAYVFWSGRSEHLGIPFATETLVMREGKILTQTFTARTDSE